MHGRWALGLFVFSLATSFAWSQELALLGVASAAAAHPEAASRSAGDREECAGDPGGADFWAKVAGKVGVTLFTDAVQVMRLRNHDRAGRSLGAREREALRPIFGELVDSVRVVWNARLLDEWKVLGKTFQFGQDVIGQTFGDTVYIAHEEPAEDLSRRRLELLIHEMAHSRQARELGGLRAFGERYIRGWWQAGRDYRSNWMEEQARCIAESGIDAAYGRYRASAPR